MSKYAYAILGLCIASVFFLNYLTRNPDQITPEENQPVDQSIDYTTGTHLGYIMSAKAESGRVYLSIDFLQSFITNKAAFLSAIEDDYCSLEKIIAHVNATYPENTNSKIIQDFQSLKTKEDTLIYFGKVSIKDIDVISPYTGCFPNGVRYTRNKSKIVRDRSISPTLRAVLSGTVVTYDNAATYFAEKGALKDSLPMYSITMSDGVVLNIEDVPAQ